MSTSWRKFCLSMNLLQLSLKDKRNDRWCFFHLCDFVLCIDYYLLLLSTKILMNVWETKVDALWPAPIWLGHISALVKMGNILQLTSTHVWVHLPAFSILCQCLRLSCTFWMFSIVPWLDSDCFVIDSKAIFKLLSYSLTIDFHKVFCRARETRF